MYLFVPKDCLQYQMYAYLIFKSTKDVIKKIKSITNSCILDSQESSIKISNV